MRRLGLGACVVGKPLAQRLLQLFAVRLLHAWIPGRGAGFGDEPCVVHAHGAPARRVSHCTNLPSPRSGAATAQKSIEK
jgi:hypothetical protein